MKLTTRGRYAVTAMLDLALRSGTTKVVALAEIAGRQGISLAYLEQLFFQVTPRRFSGECPGSGRRLPIGARRGRHFRGGYHFRYR